MNKYEPLFLLAHAPGTKNPRFRRESKPPGFLSKMPGCPPANTPWHDYHKRRGRSLAPAARGIGQGMHARVSILHHQPLQSLTVAQMLDDGFLLPLQGGLKNGLGRLAPSSPEVSEETMQLQHGLLSLLSTDGIRAAVRRNSFPLDEVVETYIHLLRLTLRDRWCLPPPNSQEYREIVVREPSPVTKKTRSIQRDRLNEVILASVRFRNMAGIAMCNASLATRLGLSEPRAARRYRLRDEDLAHALGQSMLIHRCLAVERPLLYFLIACLNHTLRKALSGFAARLDAAPAPAPFRPAPSPGYRRVACPP